MPGRLLYYLRRLLAPRPGAADRQYGAIPWRRAEDGIEFLLITSRRTGRWIFPKGGRIAWLSPQASAAQEAYEEGGVEGDIAAEPAGIYRTVRQRAEGSVELEVQMYPLEVEMVLESWPEMKQRRRIWVGLENCVLMLSEPGLVPMVRQIAGQVEAPTGSGQEGA